MTDLVSVAVLMARAQSTPQRINFELLLGANAEKTLMLVTEAVDHICREMSRNPELKQEHSEDELTIELVQALHYMGFNARHETKVGGHCDVVVEAPNDFLWLAEAKKFDSDYGWLLEGFNQLCTRYSTGSMHQGHGGMIIYIFAERTDRILERWGARLQSSIEDINVDCSASKTGHIMSVHPHQRTGADFTVRHKAVSLLWKPA